MNTWKDRISGTLYGMAIGDAMGMPSELWPRKKVQDYFGVITDFLDGPAENEVACNFTKGQYTDDSSQALLILDALMRNEFVPNTTYIAEALLNWAHEINAFDNNILGPSSKAALLAIQAGQDATPFTTKAETNGAAMRIAPIGCLFSRDRKTDLVKYVYEVSKTTHATDVAVSGAAMIAMAVSSAVEDQDWDVIMADAIEAYKLAIPYGEATYSANLAARLELALEYARQYEHDEEMFSQKIYDVIGSGVITSESIPAALAIAYYAKEPHRCSLLCANLGGDTDTIGAMATAICGAKVGVSAINPEWVNLINSNNPVQLDRYTEQLMHYRNKC